MSKALVIKGANFSANKVETITLTQPIPCTGLSISPTTKSFDTLNATQQITATLTPANTTDTVYYASSNTDVATISDSGLITCVGVGTATITVTCGEQSATCAVTSEISMTLSSYFEPYQFSSTDLSLNPPKDYGGLYIYETAEDKRGRVYASATSTGDGRKAFATGSSNPGKDYYPIMMPKGTATVELEMAEQCSLTGKIYVFASTQEQTYLTGTYENKPCAKVVQYTSTIPCVNKKYTFPITASNGDSFAIQMGNSDITQITGNATVTFKAASA